MLEKRGVATIGDILRRFPQKDIIDKGPIAVIECYQSIPCNPCSTSCPSKAITVGENINNIPQIDYSLCTGCGICVSRCPGLAIFVVDGSYSDDKVLFKIPYELLPLPEVNSIVKGLDREGKYITDVEVIKVLNSKSQDRTAIIHVLVDRKYLYDFITIKVEDEVDDNDTIVCRCSDVTLKELKDLMNEGYTTYEELKRVARIGMGPCQGRTCGQIVAREISKFTGKKIEDITTHTSRPTVIGVKLETIAGGELDDK